MPLKILNLTSTPRGIGGVESLLLSAADKYDPARFSIAYCNLFDDDAGNGIFPTALKERGATYFHIPGRQWRDLPTLVAGLVKLMRRERFDVIHSHMLHATIVGHIAARIARVPVRITSRQYTEEAFHNKGALFRALDRRLTRSATHVIAVSDAVRKTIIREDKIPPHIISVVYNSIDLHMLDAAQIDQPVPWDKSWEDSFVLGCVGSLNVRKGHADLLRALAEVLVVQPNVRLVILGEGSQREPLMALARELGIARHVLLAGFRSDIPALVRRFDLYVHPSLNETFGIAIAEAMAARRAVIGSTVGGIPEVIGNDAGLLVPPANPATLTAAILKLVANPGLAKQMGERGRQRVQELFTVETTVAKYQELYTRLAGNLHT